MKLRDLCNQKKKWVQKSVYSLANIDATMTIIEAGSKLARHQRRLFLISSEKGDYQLPPRNELREKENVISCRCFSFLIAGGRVSALTR